MSSPAWSIQARDRQSQGRSGDRAHGRSGRIFLQALRGGAADRQRGFAVRVTVEDGDSLVRTVFSGVQQGGPLGYVFGELGRTRRLGSPVPVTRATALS